MGLFLLKRSIQTLFLIWFVSLAVFVGVFQVGDPAALLIPPEADQETIDRVKHSLGLDLPLHEQYLQFLKNALQGDLGESFFFRESALVVILERLPATLELAVAAMGIAIIVGIPLGLLAGNFANTWIDKSLMVFSTLCLSIPAFWAGMLLILLFSVQLGWLPALGRGETAVFLGMELSIVTVDGLKHIFLPALNLSIFPLAYILRLTRSGMCEAMELDFVRFARAQGNSRLQVIQHYVLKYISIPIVTMVGMYFGVLIAFAVVTESVFSWPGMGKLIIDSINVLDRPIIVAYVMMIVIIFVLINFVVDLIYLILDPRVRLE